MEISLCITSGYYSKYQLYYLYVAYLYGLFFLKFRDRWRWKMREGKNEQLKQ